MTRFPYATPRAFEAALTARFKTAAEQSTFSAGQLRRQFAYDRLLARCFTGPDATQWVLKGGISMLARLRTARHTADVDLAATATTLTTSRVALTAAVATDLGDAAAPGQPARPGRTGRRELEYVRHGTPSAPAPTPGATTPAPATSPRASGGDDHLFASIVSTRRRTFGVSRQ